ncbi:MAG: M48 family peptidase, partial [Methylobacterium sp.]|nr:M48 family peptidase [Methylobacterium sp.]
MMHTLTIVFLATLATTVLLRLWLGLRQIGHVQAHRASVPAAFADSISLEAHQKAADYATAKTRLVIAEAAAQAVLLLVFTVGGLLQWLDQAWLNVIADGELLRGALVIASAFAISSLVDIPFDYHKKFVVDARFGFNKMSRKMFFSDLLKHALVGVALGAPLLFAALWLMQGAGIWWWLSLW